MLVVRARDLPFAFGPRPYLAFEYVTKVPMCRRLVDAALLTAEERAWVDAYHSEVRGAVRPLLERGVEDAAAVAWLERATAPL